MSLSKFKQFISALIRDIVARANASAAATQVKLDKMSADLTAATNLIERLNAQIAQQAAIDEQTKKLAAEGAALLQELDTFSTELAREFNPTPGTDAAIGAVTGSPVVPTPPGPVVEEINTGEPTPDKVVDSVVDSVEAAIENQID